ncbi:MAG: M48 family metallopeptidase [Bacteroides sp.]|nr:M48 family metallopeptidase [Bacteroides sp.]MCM1096087.1 M48 family metallopeptidase [Terasakiella sp.]
MSKNILKALMIAAAMCVCGQASAQFNIGRAVSGAVKAGQALTLTDAQMAEYVKEYIDGTDKLNPIAEGDDPYAVRLARLTEGLTEVDGIPLNFKVYKVIDVNAFACPDGSVRVFAGLMDIMTDEQVLGVIGHEVGHVAHRDSKNAFKRALLASALKDGISSTGGKAAALSQSQLSDLGTALMQSSFSQKQEKAADDYGYEFLKSHGKNPVAMALSFRKLLELQGGEKASKTSKINQLFSTHPELPTRIKRMEDRARKDGYTIE